jgi:hypothetical protein
MTKLNLQVDPKGRFEILSSTCGITQSVESKIRFFLTN